LFRGDKINENKKNIHVGTKNCGETDNDGREKLKIGSRSDILSGEVIGRKVINANFIALR